MFEAGHAEADGPGKLQEYGVLNKEKKIDFMFYVSTERYSSWFAIPIKILKWSGRDTWNFLLILENYVQIKDTNQQNSIFAS